MLGPNHRRFSAGLVASALVATGDGLDQDVDLSMRLVFLDDRFMEVYGAQENVLLLGQLCCQAGHEPTLVTIAQGKLSAAAQARGLQTRIVEAPPSMRQFEREAITSGVGQLLAYGRDLARFNFRMAKAIRDTNPDLIVASAVRPTLLLLATRLLVRRPIVLYAQNSIPFGFFAVLAGLISRRIALIGDGARSTFPRWFQRLFARRFVALPSGRDFNWFDRSMASTPRSGPVELITVCSITERKGLHVLVDALQRVNQNGVEARLTVVGSTTGPTSETYRTELEARIDALGLDVEFAGWHDNVLPLLQQSDLFVLASHDEGLPGVLLEAMAVGLACITTRAGSAGELVDQCGAGASVPIGDVEALSTEIERLCRDQDERTRAGEAGYQNVRRHYGLDQFLEHFEAIARPLVRTRR